MRSALMCPRGMTHVSTNKQRRLHQGPGREVRFRLLVSKATVATVKDGKYTCGQLPINAHLELEYRLT
jgi:hypothetical protein